MRDYFFLYYFVNFTRQKLKAGSIHNSVNQLLWAIGFSRPFFISADTRSSIGRYSIKYNSIYRSTIYTRPMYQPIYRPISTNTLGEVSVRYRKSIGEVSVKYRWSAKYIVRQEYRPRYRSMLDRVSTDTRSTIDRYIDRCIGRISSSAGLFEYFWLN